MDPAPDIDEIVDRITRQVLERMKGVESWPTGRSSCDGCVGCHHCVTRRAPHIDRMIAAGADRFAAGAGLRLGPEHSGLARLIDHTLLKPDATRTEIEKLCSEAARYGFASVCVNPCWVELCASMLAATPEVKVCTVIGFPFGATSTYAKAAETRAAVADGAREIDMVINVGALRSGDRAFVERDIRAVVESAQPKAIVKVILETALLSDDEKVAGCKAAMAAGAHFVKTSTGYAKSGATAHDIALMRATVGSRLGVKASGGVRDRDRALEMIEAGADRIGASASVAIVSGPETAGAGSGY